MAEIAKKMNIYEAISRCMEEIGAVGKDAVNKQQGFKYRGIDAVMNAINPAYDKLGDFELVDELSKIGNVKVPNAIEEIRNAEVRHNNLVEVDGMEAIVKKFLGI